MFDLDKYAKHFDGAYRDYADARYGEIAQLLARYDDRTVRATLHSQHFLEAASLIQPVIAVKNYKSQVPFPEALLEVISCIVEIRQTAVSPEDVFGNHQALFERLLSFQGFQLPTVSAVFHFSHPRHFPIVDVNVEAACDLLKQRCQEDFKGLEVPALPAANTSAANKLRKYRMFIAFIRRVLELQSAHVAQPSYRYVDKALMVLGVPELRTQVERVAPSKKRLGAARRS